MTDTMRAQENGPRPRLWSYPRYTEVHLADDSYLLEHPEAFGRFMLRLAKIEPVVLFIGGDHVDQA